jgi:POT family proton-dependent oligopeptide transporter
MDTQNHSNVKTDIAGGPLVDQSNAGYVADDVAGFGGEKDHHHAHSPVSSTRDGGELVESTLPSEEERRTLRHIGDPLPKSAFLVALVELCERFTYYGAQGLFQNYIQRPLDGSQGRGALGMGHKGSTGLNTFFQFWCYGTSLYGIFTTFGLTHLPVTPIFGAIIADQYLGKYNTILLFSFVYIAGLLILVTTSIPSALEHGAGLGGFIVAIIVIGIGTGGIKSNVAPLIADQYRRRQMVVGNDPKTGEKVIIDPAITIQRIYMVFYFCTSLHLTDGAARFKPTHVG